MKLNCLVIDDDPLICDLIEHFCSKIERIDYCISVETAMDGLSLLSSQDFNVIFLDYNLPQISGKSFMEMKHKSIPIVMITSHQEFAVESYEFPDVIDFLVKPLQFERFLKAVLRVEEYWMQKKETPDNYSFFVRDGYQLVRINVNEILYLKSEANYVVFQLAEKKVMSLVTLKELEKKLPENFVRVHRSYIVNIEKIDFLDPDDITIRKDKIPIGQKYKEQLLNQIKLL